MTEHLNDSVVTQAVEFGEKIAALLGGCLADAPDIEVTRSGSRVKIAPRGQSEKAAGVPLQVDGEIVAWLRIDFLCRLDSDSTFLAVDKSKMWIVAAVDQTPIVRFEYLKDADWVPHSHIQVHAQRGALSHLLSRTGHPRPHEMAALHLPTGDSRFRPNLEDVIQFLVEDCRFDGLVGWKDTVHRHRADWRRIQLRSAVRAMPEEAASKLVELGYDVRPPAGGAPADDQRALYAW